MALIDINFEKYDIDVANACMERIRGAAEVIRDEAIRRCHVGRTSRPPYKKGAYAGKAWTGREIGALKKTIRTREKYHQHGLRDRNVWIIAGNYNVWYAVQVEYGRGDWRGGAHPFMRRAIAATKGQVKMILESGAGQTKGL